MRMNSYFQLKERAPGLTPNCNNIVMEKNAKRKTGRRQVVIRLTWGAFLWDDPRGWSATGSEIRDHSDNGRLRDGPLEN